MMTMTHEKKTWLTETKTEHGVFFQSDLKFYTDIINSISENISNVNYYFMDDDLFTKHAKDGTLTLNDINRICAQEILFRAHLASVAAIYRSCRWLEGAKEAKISGNAFTWTSAVRGFIEGCGDTIYSLLQIPTTLAMINRELNECLNGEMLHGLYDFGEIEKPLVHFTHARRGAKKDFEGGDNRSDHSHLEAKPSFKYIGEAVNTKIADELPSLYKTLCEVVHPASASVLHIFQDTPNGMCFNCLGQSQLILKIEEDHEKAILSLPQVAFNLPLLILRVLQEFPIFEKHKELSGIRFDNRISKEIEEYLGG